MQVVQVLQVLQVLQVVQRSSEGGLRGVARLFKPLGTLCTHDAHAHLSCNAWSDAKAIARVVLKLFHTSCVRTGWYSETLTDTHSAIRVTHARACVHARPYARTHANAHAPIPTHGHGFFCIRGRAAAGTWVVILCARHRWGVASTRAWFTSQARKITTLNDRALIQNALYQLLQTLPHRRMISGQTTSQQPIWLVRLYQNLKRSHRHFLFVLVNSRGEP